MSATTTHEANPVAGAWKGTILGLLNTIVIAIGLAASDGEAGIFMLVLIFGAVPGMFAGCLIGILSAMTGRQPTIARVIMLIAPAIGVVALLADEFRLENYAVVASIPTVVSCLILERWTRLRQPPAVPVAHARLA